MLPQVITPSSGGPAERAGIEPQDILIAIGDRPMQNVSLYEAGDLLQGTEGTEVRRYSGLCLGSLQSVHSIVCETANWACGS